MNYGLVRHSVFASGANALSVMALGILLLLPTLQWQYSSDAISYLKHPELLPAGQVPYVFSKLFALYAIFFIWFQCIATLLKNQLARLHIWRWQLFRHQILAALIISLSALHVGCFFLAVAVRNGEPNWALLTVDFSDYYRGAISVGLLALLFLSVGVVFAVFRNQLQRHWRWLHRCVLGAVVLGLIHSWLIGTETRGGINGYVYIAMFVSLIIASAVWASELRKGRSI